MILAGGWTAWRWAEDDTPVTTRVRFAEEAGRLVPIEIRVETRPLTAEIVRRLPLGEMEATANGEARKEILTGLDPDADHSGLVSFTFDHGHASTVRRPRQLRLNIPPGPRRPDSFYRRVADLYLALVASGARSPAADIANANDVPVTTAHRWIKEARARRLLAPGRHGKAG